MKHFLLKLLPIMYCMFSAMDMQGKSVDSTILVLDFPVSSKESKFSQRISYQTEIDTVVHIEIDCYYFNAIYDSIHLYDLKFENIHINAGAAYIDLPFAKAVSTHKMHTDYFDVISKFKMVPAGMYKTSVRFISADDKRQVLLSSRIEQFADSNLTASSGLREKMNDAMALPGSAKTSTQKLSNNPEDLKTADAKLKRKLRPVKGLDMRSKTINGQVYSEAFYKGFFLGRYEMGSVHDVSEKAKQHAKALTDNTSSLVDNELEGFKSVGSQLKELNELMNKEDKLKGTIDVNTYRATAQDPQSAVEQNYTELLGNIDAEVMGLPFSIEGFYTTQDANRQAKASYFRFHYDIETVKQKLQKTINGYKTKMGETVAKGQGLENVYGNYAKSLDAQKDGLLKSMSREYGVDAATITDNEGNVNKILAKMPSTDDTSKILNTATDQLPRAGSKTRSVAEKKEKLMTDKKTFEEKYQKIVTLAQKAEKYYTLLQDYKNKVHLDSAINYSKMDALQKKDASYKDMSKAAAGILPEGKAKNFITGLTNFDAGIINKYESDYTMAGQTMKGLSMGYDLGAFKTGISMGSTEYISREGNVDHYSTMLLRVDNKGSKNHKIGLLYNLNTPAKSMTIDENFMGKEGMRYPGFNTATQIASLVYDGQIAKRLTIHSELASSFKSGQSSKFDMAHSALNNSVEYSIPGSSMNLKGAWEHLGNSFENNALPYIRSGTERYTLGTGFDLFRSFLSVKVDYNYLLQQSFSSTGYNTKWGFELKTHSKRYPSVSLSYKPFSTFRSFADTLQIAQRPIQGEVWTARSSYQIKRHKNVHRFTFMYNKNSSTADTINYSSSTAQLGYIYSCPKISLNASLSRIELPTNFADGTGMISSYTTGFGINKTIGKQVNVSLGKDLSFCGWGLQRISGTASVSFKMAKKPLAFRMMLRYSQYKLTETAEPIDLYAGMMGFNLQFKAMKKKKTTIN